jgi:hypothetical protein
MCQAEEQSKPADRLTRATLSANDKIPGYLNGLEVTKSLRDAIDKIAKTYDDKLFTLGMLRRGLRALNTVVFLMRPKSVKGVAATQSSHNKAIVQSGIDAFKAWGFDVKPKPSGGVEFAIGYGQPNSITVDLIQQLAEVFHGLGDKDTCQQLVDWSLGVYVLDHVDESEFALQGVTQKKAIEKHMSEEAKKSQEKP